jgi:hypothetical protein
MVKPATVNRIRILSKKGKSANEIARQLRREGRGIRRKTILAYAREFKGRKHKAQPYKYVPRKYRRPIAPLPTPEQRKHIAIYGTHKRKSKRYEASGKGKALYRFLIDAVQHPPKQRITRVSVKDYMGISDRAQYIDYKEEWDDRPTVKS